MHENEVQSVLCGVECMYVVEHVTWFMCGTGAFFLMYVHVFVQGTISFSLNLHMTFMSISLQVVHYNDNNNKKQGCCIQTEMLD